MADECCRSESSVSVSDSVKSASDKDDDNRQSCILNVLDLLGGGADDKYDIDFSAE